MKRLLLVVALVMLAAVGLAETKKYVGPSNGSWSGHNQWDPVGNPGVGDDVLIPEGKWVNAIDGGINIRSLTISGGGAKLILGAASTAPGTVASFSGDLTVTDGAKLYVYAGALTDLSVFADQATATAAIYANPTVVSVGGTLTVSGGAVVYPENEPVTGAAVFFRVGDFNLAEDGTFDTVNRGWNLQMPSKLDVLPVGAKARCYNNKDWGWTYAFGAGVDYGWGAGYGGLPLMQKNVSEPAATSPAVEWTSVWRSGETYGSACAPFLPGSPSGRWSSYCSRGSGTIAVFATNTVTIAGTLDASGKPTDAYVSIPGSSGGSVWVCGKTVELTETSSLLAKGGKTLGYDYGTGCGGGGGRISVGIGLTQDEIDELAACLVPPEEHFFTEPLTSPGVVSVEGGPDKSEVHFGNPGTATCVHSMVGKARVTVTGSPVEARSEGVVYDTFLVDCSETLVYVSDAYGRFPSDPEGATRQCLGWVASNATEEIARSAEGTKLRAELVGLDWQDGPFRLVWQWGEAVQGRNVCIDCPSGGTVTARGVTHTESFSLLADDEDEMTAAANKGYRFLGWAGLPSGFTPDATITLPAEPGLVVTALFVSESGTGNPKTWSPGADQRWTVPSNWRPAGVPTLMDDVVITGAKDCLIPFSAIARSITVDAGARLKMGTTSTDPAAKPVADNADERKIRSLVVAGDVTCAGSLLLGGSGASFTKLDVHIGGNLTLNGAAKMSVYPIPLDLSLASTPDNLYYAATIFTIGGDLTLNGTSTLYPWCDTYTGTAVRFDVGTNVTVASGAAINAEGLGWFWRPYTVETADPLRTFTFKYSAGSDLTTTFETRSLGGSDNYNTGAGHGTCGNNNGPTPHATRGHEYGLASAPFLPGSASPSYNIVYPLHAGGGAVWIKCGRKITIDGTVKANAEKFDQNASFYGGASGGSVWLIGRGLGAGPTASVSARGGRSNYGYSAGAGGRVSIALGVSDEDLEALAMGEHPADLEYAESTDLVPVDVRGGEDGSWGGSTICTQTGTVSIVKGPNADKSLTVGAAVLAGAPSPVYGATPVMVGEVLTLTATENPDGTGADPADPESTRWHCAGYVVSNATEQLKAGTESSFAFTMPNENVFVTWLWEGRESGVNLSVANPQGAAYGTILVDGVMHEPGTKKWIDCGADYTVEAVPADGYEFLCWSGDFPYGAAHVNPLTQAARSGATLQPVFRRIEAPAVRTWLKTGNASGGDFLDETLWSGGNFPGPGDDVVVTQGVCQVRNNHVEIRSLVVSNANVRFLVGMTVNLNNGLQNPKFADAENRTQTTYFPPTVSALADEVSLLVAGDVTVDGGAQLGVGAPNALRAAHGRLEAANVTLSGDAELLVTAGAVDDRFTFATGAGFVKVAGTFAVNGTAKFRPVSDGWTGGSVKTTADAFTLAAGAQIRAKGAGFIRKKVAAEGSAANVSLGLGQGYDYNRGAGYGGIGGGGGTPAHYGDSYGFERAPIHPGSPNGFYLSPFMAGGGLVRIHAKTMSIFGSIDASAEDAPWNWQNFFGGASGGGIWLTAANLAFGDAVTMDVRGGHTTYASVGAGGRIAIGEISDPGALEALAANGMATGCASRSFAKFSSVYPGVTVNLRGGSVYTTNVGHDHELVRECAPENDGTFRYVVPSGVVLIVR